MTASLRLAGSGIECAVSMHGRTVLSGAWRSPAHDDTAVACWRWRGARAVRWRDDAGEAGTADRIARPGDECRVECRGAARADHAEHPCGQNLDEARSCRARPILSELDALRLFGQSRSPEALPTRGRRGRRREAEKVRPPIEWDEIRARGTRGPRQSQGPSAAGATSGTAVLRTDGLSGVLRHAHDRVAVARDLLAGRVSAAGRR